MQTVAFMSTLHFRGSFRFDARPTASAAGRTRVFAVFAVVAFGRLLCVSVSLWLHSIHMSA